MTAIHTYVLQCDGCGAQYRTDPPLRRAFDTRGLAAAEGWQHRIVQITRGPNPSQDFCPACVPKPKARAKRPPKPPAVLPADLASYTAAVLRSCLYEGLAHPDIAERALECLQR